MRSTLISPRHVVRVIFMVAALLVAVGSSAAVPAGATPDVYQDTEPDDPAIADDDEFDGRSTADTVNIVVGSLIAVAGATALSMLMFIWHTSPRRRLRVATRRAERRRASVAQHADESEDVVDHGNTGEGDLGEDDEEELTASDDEFDQDDDDDAHGDAAEDDDGEDDDAHGDEDAAEDDDADDCQRSGADRSEDADASDSRD